MENQKKNQTKNIGFVLLATVFGFALGYMILALIPNDIGRAGFYAIPILLILLYLCYLLQIVVHEVGHLIFGLLTGYSFVSLRVGPFMLIRSEGKIRFSNLNIPGTGGQCLMDPPAYHQGDYPFLLYNLGGGLFNLALAVSSLLLMNASLPFFLNAFLICFGLTGFLAAATNLYPMKVNGIPTDGYNILSIYRNKTVKQAFWLQLKGNALLSEGVEPKELPVEDFKVEEKEMLTIPLITSIQLYQYNHYLDQMNFEKAQTTLNELIPYLKDFIPIYQNEIKMQLIFLELIGENKPESVNQLFDEDLHQHLQMTPNWLNRKRFFMAYEWFHNQNKEKAMKNYQMLQELAAKHPHTGEARMELKLGEWIKEQIILSSNEPSTTL